LTLKHSILLMHFGEQMEKKENEVYVQLELYQKRLLNIALIEQVFFFFFE